MYGLLEMYAYIDGKLKMWLRVRNQNKSSEVRNLISRLYCI